MKPWTQWFGQQMQGTSGTQMGKTLLEILSKERVVIEHHRGIQCYGTDEILVRTTFGQLRISGSGLKLCCMSREQLCITGQVDAVELIGRTANGTLE